jgi:apolipoprotein N-acyltransferase
VPTLTSEAHLASPHGGPTATSRAGAAIARGCASVAAGLLMFASFPPRSLWFAAPLGVALLVLVVRGRSVWGACQWGYLGGLGFFVPLLPWVGVYVGAMPWLALSALEATAFALFGTLAAAVQRLPGAPLWVACAWTTTEALRARVPFGGFPWGRLAFGQTDGPLLALARVGGAPTVTFVVAALGAGLAAGLMGALAGRWRSAAWAPGVGVAAIVLTLATPPDAAASPSVTVAVVQGNVPRLGLDFNAQRRAVLDNHVARTRLLTADVAAGKIPRPDLVIWPENSSDIDPLRNPDAAARIDDVADELGVPILVGAVLDNPDGTSRNTSIVWNPGTGPGAFHDKRKLVPFGEYLPMRPLVTHLSPLASRVGNFVPGTGNGTVLDNGVVLGVATCYEVAFDDLVRDSVRAGAQLITVPTNNATFGRTTMTYQQLAMSRLRAVEHHRSVLVAATSGVSAVISPDGSVVRQTGLFTADTIVARVPLHTDLTLAAEIRSSPEILAATLTLLAALFTWRRARART